MEFGPDTLELDVSGDGAAGEAGAPLAALRDMPRTPVDVAERADLALEDDRLLAGKPSPPATDLRPRYLSPSSASMYKQCARKWKYRYVDKLADPPGEAALAGTFAHRVLELLLQLPAEQRTVDEAKRLARAVWPETAKDLDYKALRLDDAGERQFRWRGWQAVEGLWTIEDPASVTVHATEHDVKIEVGGVPFRGIVDRIDVEKDHFVISDYKSGRAPSMRFVDERLAQVLLYAAAVRELMGATPSRARLLYLGQSIIDIEVTDANLAHAIGTLQTTWKSLISDCDRQEFSPQTGPLCAWCPFVNQCDAGQVEVRQRHAAGKVRPDAPGLRVLPAAG